MRTAPSPPSPKPATSIEPRFDFGIYGMSVLVMGFIAATFYFLAVASFGDAWDFGVAYYTHGGAEINSLCSYISADLDAAYAANLLLWPFLCFLGFFAERFVTYSRIAPGSDPRPAIRC